MAPVDLVAPDLTNLTNVGYWAAMPYPTAEESDPLPALLREIVRPKAGRARWATALAQELDRRIARVAETAPAYAPGGSPRMMYPPDALGGGVDRAVREGERFKRDRLSRPDMLSPDRAAARAGITRQALDDRRKKGRALALSHLKRGFRYPAWQFDDGVATDVARVLPELRHLDPWGQFLFFTQNEPLLDADTPLEALRAGDVDRVLHVVRALREDGPA